MYWGGIFGFLLFTTALYNKDSGPAQVIAFYLLRKFEEESGVKPLQIAPNCPLPYDFQNFIQHVSPKDPRNGRPHYEHMNWGKVTDAGLLNKQEAMEALRTLGYAGSILNNVLFTGAIPAYFEDIKFKLQLHISIARAARLANGLPPIGGSYSLMMDYWKITSDARRKNLADNIFKSFEKAFAKRFNEAELKPVPTQPISRPLVPPYVQIDILQTLANARNLQLPAQDLEDFINNYVKNWNDGPRRTHLEALTLADEFVKCYKV